MTIPAIPQTPKPSTDEFSPIIASPTAKALLRNLHKLSEVQEKSWSQAFFYLKCLIRFIASGELWSAAADDYMRDKFVSLAEDKCQFIYLLARSLRAYNVVEAGTSFGVSTIYLALAVSQNVQLDRNGSAGTGGKVIATEKEACKAAKAREYWKELGDEVEPWIELRQGDLLETLKIDDGMPSEIDLLLLDSMITL